MRHSHGFTLVELLVVIAIIAILAGLSTVGLRVAQRSSEENVARHDISLMQTAIASFTNEMGDYPPTVFTTIKVRGVNAINEGNECLLVCLQTRKKGGPFLSDLDESRLVNTDGDRLSAAAKAKLSESLDYSPPGDQLLEYTDNWGNPFVYIHHRDYGSELLYQLPSGETIRVKAARSDLGGYSAPRSYQLWSLGPDMKNDNGAGDDICSWTTR